MPPSRPTARTAAVGPPSHPREPARLCFHGGGGLAAHDRLEEALDVRAGQVLERLFAEQGEDVARDPPAIDLEGAGLLGQALAADDEPGLGFRQILAAQIGNGDRVPLLVPLLRGI